MYQLAKQETADCGAIIDGSRIHGTFRGYARSGVVEGFLCELGEITSDEAIKIYEDNQGSIALAKNPEFLKRTKHIDIRYHFVREKVEDNQVVLEYCPTQDMLADIMTKSIPATQFCILRSKLGIQAPRAVESSGSVVEDAVTGVEDTTPRPAVQYR